MKKTKVYAYISNPVEFLTHDTGLKLSPYPCDFMDEWILVGEFEIDLAVDKDMLVKKALSAIDQAEQAAKTEMQEKLNKLEDLKQSLIALPEL